MAEGMEKDILMSFSELCPCALECAHPHTRMHVTHTLTRVRTKLPSSGEPYANFSSFKYAGTHCADPCPVGHPSLHRQKAF